MKHISEILPKVMSEVEIKNEIHRLTNRHIAKLLTRLQERYSIESDIIAGIKAQFRMFENDVINHIGEINENKNDKA